MPNRRSMFGAFGRRPAPTYPVGPGAFIAPEGITPEPLTSARVGVERPFRPSFPAGPGAFIDPGLANNSVDREVWRQPEATATWAQGMASTGRGMEPPSAARPNQADADNQAWQEANRMAQEYIAQNGTPYFTSPSVVNAGDAMASAVDGNRAAQQEMARREGVSWEDWWRFHGRQGEANAAPFDLQNAYRPGRAPQRYGAQSRRPGPR
jgi:hypothetical protein